MTQPLDSDFILTLNDVVRVTTISRSQLYRMMTAGDFPQPLVLSKQRIGWRQSDIARWTRALSAKDICGPAQRNMKPPNEGGG